jgi:hypothetical protein
VSQGSGGLRFAMAIAPALMMIMLLMWKSSGTRPRAD